MAGTRPKLKNRILLPNSEFDWESNNAKKKRGFNITFFELGQKKKLKGVKMCPHLV